MICINDGNNTLTVCSCPGMVQSCWCWWCWWRGRSSSASVSQSPSIPATHHQTAEYCQKPSDAFSHAYIFPLHTTICDLSVSFFNPNSEGVPATQDPKIQKFQEFWNSDIFFIFFVQNWLPRTQRPFPLNSWWKNGPFWCKNHCSSSKTVDFSIFSGGAKKK